MDTAVERWTALINARAQQMDATYARLGRTSADYWDRQVVSPLDKGIGSRGSFPP
jgi:hypothetical protein